MGDSHVSNSKIVEHSEIPQATVNRMTSLKAHKAGKFAFFEGIQYSFEWQLHILYIIDINSNSVSPHVVKDCQFAEKWIRLQWFSRPLNKYVF